MPARGGIEQRLRVGVPRVGEDLGGLAVLDDLALVHDGHPVADLGGDPKIVGDEEHGQVEALADVVEQRQHLGLNRYIQGGNGLIGDQEFRLHGQGAGDADPLPLAAGELVRETVQGLGVETDQGHEVARPSPGLVLRSAEVHGAFDDRLSDRAPRVERAVGVLEDDLHPAPMMAKLAHGQPGDVVVVDLDLSAGGIDQADDTAGHRRFAGARLADNPQGLAAAHLDVHVPGGPDLAGLLEETGRAVDFAELAGRKHDRCGVLFRARPRGHAGDGRDQHARIAVSGLSQDLVGTALFDDAAGLHHRHLVGDLGDHAEVVGDEQNGGVVALLDVLDELEDLRLGGHVQGGGRLVGDQQRGLQGQGRGDHDALALAAGELMRI